MKIQLLAIQPGDVDKAWLVEYAARVCHNSPMSSDLPARLRFLSKLSAAGHYSVFEHARFCEFDHVFRQPRIDEVSEAHNGYWLHSYNARHVIEARRVSDTELLALFDREPQIPFGGLTAAQRLTHATATFEFTDISVLCAAQIARHRIGGVSQESHSYVRREAVPVMPPSIACNEAARYIYQNALACVEDSLDELLALGVPLEDARYVAAQATPTRMVVTKRFIWWKDFLKKRLDPPAKFEVRQVAAEVMDYLHAADPEVFNAL